ncbi:MAG: hypothetical protein RBR93_09395 [Aliarcobacter butzleri]|uniref:hypothetical protein n=2 Tax=Aliarcobacter butzleri TaxID=28197 RepID=UPI00263C0DDD|nr:hypothetical protein [Aliarcobacter butzleri]MDN5092718.1 hypothetical protein [Aliarcobacter butzleri]MDY0193731.1 hypothetical protein [Aliarcobacter butzleri]
MSLKRGVVTEITSTSARPISVTSTLPIALVLKSSVVPAGIYGFESPKKALEYFSKEHPLLKDDLGNLKKYIAIGEDMFALIVPTVISVCEVTEDENEQKANFINAINVLKQAPSLTGYKFDIIAIGYDDFDMDVNNAVDNICKALKARTFINLYATTNSEAITRRENFGSDRVTVAKCSIELFNTTTAKTEEYDSGIILAFLRCSIDGSSGTGYAQSISNRVLNISGVSSPSEFYAGALDETDPLTEKQIMSFIHYKGFRTWEYSTTSEDQIWQDARRVRIFDLAAMSVIDGIFFAVDRDISALSSAKDSLRGFMNGLVGDDVVAGFSVELDTDRTTKERITAGEFYFIIDAQEMPSPRLIHVTFNRVDRYSEVIYKLINGEE